MLTFKDFMQLINYKPTEIGEYTVPYYREATAIECWDGNQDGFSLSLICSLRNDETYEVQLCDFKRQRAYRIINEKYRTAHADYVATQNETYDQAWDEVSYVDLETDEDFVEKATKVMNDEEYDTRVVIPFELPDDVIYTLMKEAHRKDITFNALISETLINHINKLELEQQ